VVGTSLEVDTLTGNVSPPKIMDNGPCPAEDIPS